MLSPMRSLLILVALASTAYAGEALRFGVTAGLKDPDATGHFELGPMIGVGERLGPFLGELDYSYLSFIDPDTNGGQVQRLGLNLRFDVDRSYGRCLFYACTRATSFYVEAGAAERFGHWFVDDAHVSPVRSPNPEAHVGLGLEFDNQIHPHRNGWQFGLRFAITPKDAFYDTACRGTSCMTNAASSASGGTNVSVFVEWMYLLGN
jgi:hypothetical protein